MKTFKQIFGLAVVCFVIAVGYTNCSTQFSSGDLVEGVAKINPGSTNTGNPKRLLTNEDTNRMVSWIANRIYRCGGEPSFQQAYSRVYRSVTLASSLYENVRGITFEYMDRHTTEFNYPVDTIIVDQCGQSLWWINCGNFYNQTSGVNEESLRDSIRSVCGTLVSDAPAQ